jgi:glycosyltransferase involved in cell wall biosynthesis
LLHARRVPTPPLPPGRDLWSYYTVPPGPRPEVVAVPCVDWIDRVPRKLQYLPARLQELSFARNAARIARRMHAGAAVLSREVETADALVRRAGAPVFLEIHRVPGGDKRRAWLLRAAPLCAGIVAISGGVRDDLVELGIDADSIAVEHDAMEPTRFANPPSKEDARRELGIEAGASVVVYTGGLLVWKGVGLLVDVARSMPELLFLIVGGMDEDVQRLRADLRGAKNVRVEGFQPPERVVTYLAAADVGVVPNRSAPEISARYTSPLKVFEAMAVGLPLVVSDLPSLREILTPDEDAVFVDPDDASALRLGLARLLRKKELCDSIRARLLARAPRHTWDARARRLLSWMRKAAA